MTRAVCLNVTKLVSFIYFGKKLALINIVCFFFFPSFLVLGGEYRDHCIPLFEFDHLLQISKLPIMLLYFLIC